MINTKKLNFKKMNGLIPTIIQNVNNAEILMLGYMSEESLKATIKTGNVTFWSRSKNRIWQKGETSGNILKLKNIQIDCDGDAILIQADPVGPTCHKGTNSCFGTCKSNVNFLHELYDLIKDRQKNMPENSYTTSLFKKGITEIAKKFGEEAVEVVIATTKQSKKRIVEESADLLYHLLVLLIAKNVKLTDVLEELRKRKK
ncbi:MAG: bifunctional phosphoribosyl-AMP cyclohydrolase/phosphoribosyl-ATP diphosphatase HisIE [Candidatus Gracilibacteria bacterium]